VLSFVLASTSIRFSESLSRFFLACVFFLNKYKKKSVKLKKDVKERTIIKSTNRGGLKKN
jgi:hypothetical protein